MRRDRSGLSGDNLTVSSILQRVAMQRDLTTTTMRLPAPVVVLDRRVATHRVGATLAEIVADATPHLPASARARLRVALVTAHGVDVVAPEQWGVVRPKIGVHVVIRSVPSGSGLRSVLMIVVAIAAAFLAPMLGGALAGTLGLSATTWSALATIGVTAIGMLLINALVPVRKRSDDKEYGGYSIQGWKNTANPDGPVPAPLGRLRMAPYYLVAPFIEIVGDLQYVRAAFVWGYGPLVLSELRFGDTSIDEYDEVQIEHRQGWADDEQLTLVTQQVIEEGLSIELTRNWQRNDDGSYLDGGSTIEKPQVRYTAADVTEAAVVIGFPAGLVVYNDDGDKKNQRVDIRIRQRPLGATDWLEVTTLAIVAAKTIAFWRCHRWTLPARGAWEIELTRMTDEVKSSQSSDRTVWQALQSFRPEYPLDFDAPLAVTAIRVKATEQLNGTLDDFNGIASRIALDWDAETRAWTTRETRSPAAALRWILQGPAAAYPVSDVGIDLELLADWSEWCATKGLRYDRVHDAEESLADALLAVAHAGRATPRHDGVVWGVVIDRPSTLVVDHINPRNSRDFKWTRTYPKNPDGFRVKFQDSTNDWKASERIVPWPGLTGDVTVTEALDLIGKCDPDEIWVEARRRMWEIELRPDTFQVTQDGLARVATRGDVVALSHDVLVRTQAAGRVVRAVGAFVELDEEIEWASGVDYAARYRVFAEADDTIGTSTVRRIAAIEGRSKAFRLIGAGTTPAIGDIVHVGPVDEESLLCKVRGEERGDAGAVIYHLVAAAPEIDTRTDAEEPPAWNGRAGSTYIGTGATTAPAAPVIENVASGVAGTGTAAGLTVRLSPGSGSAAIVYHYIVDHRLSGAASWSHTTILASNGGGAIAGYAAGDDVELRAEAVSLYGIVGPYGPVVSVTIGADDVVVPDVTAIAVDRPTDGLRSYALETASSSVTIAGWRLRARPGSGWGWADLTALHAGLLSSTPWQVAAPVASGSWTVGAVAVSSDGTESPHPYETVVSLPSLHDVGVVADRIESALGWTGAVVGGSVVSGALVGAAAGTDLVYTLPTIDLGADTAIVVAGASYGVVGTAAIAMRIGSDADGAPTGSALALGSANCRYLSIMVTIVSTAEAPCLGDVASLVRMII